VHQSGRWGSNPQPPAPHAGGLPPTLHPVSQEFQVPGSTFQVKNRLRLLTWNLELETWNSVLSRRGGSRTRSSRYPKPVGYLQPISPIQHPARESNPPTQ